MAFKAPALHTTISAENYYSQFNQNFSKIQTAFYTLQNDIAALLAGSTPAASNLSFIDQLLRPNGIIGTDSWVLSITHDTDVGEKTLTISHPSAAGYSYAVINNMLHYSNTSVTRDLSSLFPSNGTYTVNVGLKSVGYPGIEYIVEESVGATDEEADLVLWSFTLEVTSGVYNVSNLQREATMLINREAFNDLFTQEEVITFTKSGAVGAAGLSGYGFTIPYDCEVVKAYFHLNSAPTPGIAPEVQLVEEANLTDGNILSATAIWGDTDNADTGVVEVSGLDPLKQLSAGSFVKLEILTGDSTAADLTITVLVRKMHHSIWP